MDAADFSLSARQALQMDKLVVPPGGDRIVEPGLWSYLRRQALNHGTATIAGEASEVVVTLPVTMPDASFTVVATIAVTAGIAAAMVNSPIHVAAEVDSASQITLSVIDANGGAVLVPAGESLDIFWAVRE